MTVVYINVLLCCQKAALRFLPPLAGRCPKFADFSHFLEELVIASGSHTAENARVCPPIPAIASTFSASSALEKPLPPRGIGKHRPVFRHSRRHGSHVALKKLPFSHSSPQAYHARSGTARPARGPCLERHGWPGPEPSRHLSPFGGRSPPILAAGKFIMAYDVCMALIVAFTTWRGAVKGVAWQIAGIAALVLCFLFATPVSLAIAPLIRSSLPSIAGSPCWQPT